MSRAGTWCWGLFALGVLGLLTSEKTTAQEPDARLEKVFADWAKRRERTKSVRYVTRGETVLPKGSLRAPIGQSSSREAPPRDIVSRVTQTMLLDFEKQRHRLETEQEEYDAGTDKVYPRVVTRLFDGKRTGAWRPRELNTHPVTGVKPWEADIGYGSGYIGGGSSFEFGYWPFFLGHGIVGWQGGTIIAGKLNVQPDRDLVTVHGQGVHQGRPCLVLRTLTKRRSMTSYDEFWVDTARDSAVVRQLYVINKTAFLELDIEYQTTEHGWLPRRWTCTDREVGTDKTVWISRHRVEELRLDPPVSDADFRFEEKPGMLVREYVYATPNPTGPDPEPKATTYRIGEEGKRREVVIEGGIERRVGFRWWWAAPLVPAVLLPAWLAYRRVKWRRAVLK